MTGESAKTYGIDRSESYINEIEGEFARPATEGPIIGEVPHYMMAIFLNADVVDAYEFEEVPGVVLTKGVIDEGELFNEGPGGVFLTMETRNELQCMLNNNSITLPRPMGPRAMESPLWDRLKDISSLTPKKRKAVWREMHVTSKRMGARAMVVTDDEEEESAENRELIKDVSRRVTIAKLSMPMAPFNPFSTYAVLWTCFMVLVNNVYVGMIVPILTAWEVAFYPFTWATVVDSICGSVYLIDIYVNYKSAKIVTHNSIQKLILDKDVIARMYRRRVDGLFLDILCSIPFLLDIISTISRSATGGDKGLFEDHTHLLRVLRLFRIFKFLRLVKLGSSSGSLGMEAILRNSWMRVIPPIVIYVMSMVHVFFLLVNLFACIFFWCANGLCGYEKDRTWVQDYGEDLWEAGLTRQYVVSLYWSMMTISTVGYGDVIAVNNSEQAIAMVTMFIGTLFFGLNCGKLASLLEQVGGGKSQAEFRHNIAKLEQWMQSRNLSDDVATRIMAHCTGSWVTSDHGGENDKSVLEMLPFQLRAETVAYLIAPVLGDLMGEVEMDHTVIRAIAERVDILFVLPGQYIIVEGSQADALFILQRGSVDVLEHGVARHKMEDGDLFGAIACLECNTPECTHEACSVNVVSVRATSSCDIWELAEDRIMTVIGESELLVSSFKKLLTDFNHDNRVSRWTMSILQRKGSSLLQDGLKLENLPVKAISRRASILVTSRSTVPMDGFRRPPASNSCVSDFAQGNTEYESGDETRAVRRTFSDGNRSDDASTSQTSRDGGFDVLHAAKSPLDPNRMRSKVAGGTIPRQPSASMETAAALPSASPLHQAQGLAAARILDLASSRAAAAARHKRMSEGAGLHRMKSIDSISSPNTASRWSLVRDAALGEGWSGASAEQITNDLATVRSLKEQDAKLTALLTQNYDTHVLLKQVIKQNKELKREVSLIKGHTLQMTSSVVAVGSDQRMHIRDEPLHVGDISRLKSGSFVRRLQGLRGNSLRNLQKSMGRNSESRKSDRESDKTPTGIQ